MSLSEKSNAELGKLLSEYGIKHGPIVESTRKLYEKKLEKAMARAVEKPSPTADKTYYREEVEEITYITYHTPVRREVHWGVVKQRGNAGTNEDGECITESPIQSTNNTANHSTVQSKKPVRKFGDSAWRVIWLLLLLLILAVLAAVFYYYAYCEVINQEENGENAEKAENPSGIE